MADGDLFIHVQVTVDAPTVSSGGSAGTVSNGGSAGVVDRPTVGSVT